MILRNIILLFIISILYACNPSFIELSNDFSIIYSDVSHDYNLHYRSEGLIRGDFNINAYAESNTHIFLLDKETLSVYSVNKNQFAKKYGKSEAWDFVNHYSSEKRMREQMKLENKLDWIILD